MKKIYKIAVCGTGHIAKTFHIPAWLQNKNCQVVGLYDKNHQQLKEVAKKFRINKTYKNFNSLLMDKNIDVINICTPPSVHVNNITKAIKFKKNILVEKPLVKNFNEFKKIEKMLKKNKNIYLQCGLHQRYRPVSIKIKNEIKKKTIGKIYYINVIHRKFRGIPTHSSVFSNKKLSGGGPLIDLGTHYFDLVSWYLNFPKIKSLNCKLKNNIFKNPKSKIFLPFKKFNNEELCLGNINFYDDVFLNFEIGYALNVKDECRKIEIFGSKGSLIWPDNKMFVLKQNKLNERKLKIENTKASFSQVNSFLKNIKYKKSNKNIDEYGYIVRLIDMLYKSSKSNV